MKSTGIVRRIDDLGRVVIPKEIRRTMRIRGGDPMEIYTDQDGTVIFKKFSPIGEFCDFADQYAEIFNKITGNGVIICDRDCCIATAGIPKKEVLERRISNNLEEIMCGRKSKSFSSDDTPPTALEGCEYTIGAAAPIVSAGDIYGAVIFVANPNAPADKYEAKLANAAAQILAKHIESVQ